jgi:hypothetical protein
MAYHLKEPPKKYSQYLRKKESVLGVVYVKIVEMQGVEPWS